MERYETPETAIIKFETEDVITTSGGIDFGGGEDYYVLNQKRLLHLHQSFLRKRGEV